MDRKEALQILGVVGLSPFAYRLQPATTEPNKGQTKRTIGTPVSERLALQPFGYNEVKLQNSSLSRQIAITKKYYLHIPNDDLLKGFRERVGLPTYGAKNLGGWYSKDKAHIFGQIISGLSRLYAVTGDEDCKTKTAALIEGWAQCIEPDGYFFTHPLLVGADIMLMIKWSAGWSMPTFLPVMKKP